MKHLPVIICLYNRGGYLIRINIELRIIMKLEKIAFRCFGDGDGFIRLRTGGRKYSGNRGGCCITDISPLAGCSEDCRIDIFVNPVLPEGMDKFF